MGTIQSWSKFLTILIVSMFLGLSALLYAASAAEITYTGDGSDLQNSPSWFLPGVSTNYLFPGTDTAPLSSDNSVTVEYSADITMTNPSYVIGGLSELEDVTNNTVTIGGGKINGEVYGGYSDSGIVTSNAVTISAGTVYSDVFGGSSENGNAVNNTVTINGGSVSGHVVGGRSENGNAVNNTVTINGGSVSGHVVGGRSENGNAVNNTVTVSGGKINGGIYGVYGGWSTDGIATGNAVVISGGEVTGSVYGGVTAFGEATYNTVTISGNPTLATSHIYGGYFHSGGADAFTGNTLNFKSSGISAYYVANFQYYNFYLPTGTAANDTMLIISTGVDLAGTTAEIFLQGATTLQAGDEVVLINCPGISGAPINGIHNAPNNTTSQAKLGAFLTYDFDIYTDNYYAYGHSQNLWAKLVAINLAPENEALTISRLAPLAFLNQGADMVTALEYLEVSGDRRFDTFAIVGGGSSTYNVGSDLDIDGYSLLTGLMWSSPVKNRDRLILSAFFEAGWGSYDTYGIYGGNSVKGSGDMDYYGAGLLMRYKWNVDKPGGLYAESSVRLGRIRTDFDSSDLAVFGTNFHYDSGSNYYGIHAGLGYVWQLSGKTRLEATSKYTWTYLAGDDVIASTGDHISFDSLSSHRLRTGFRLYHDYGSAKSVTMYYGAAYEYEFDGNAAGRLAWAYGIDESSLSGGSGIGELGIIYRPSDKDDRLILQLGVQGYVGTREGVSGMLKIQYAF